MVRSVDSLKPIFEPPKKGVKVAIIITCVALTALATLAVALVTWQFFPPIPGPGGGLMMVTLSFSGMTGGITGLITRATGEGIYEHIPKLTRWWINRQHILQHQASHTAQDPLKGNLLRLPNEVLDRVFDFVPPLDILQIAQTCQDMRISCHAVIIGKAQLYGYEGDSHLKAVAYLNVFNRDLSDETWTQYLPQHLSSSLSRVNPNLRVYHFGSLSLTGSDVVRTLSRIRDYNHDSTFFSSLTQYSAKKLESIAKASYSQQEKEIMERQLVDSARWHNRTRTALFVKMGTDPNTPSQPYAPLHYAIGSGATDLATDLIHYKANVNRLSKEGKTPLMLALGIPWNYSYYPLSEMQAEGCTRLLLENGADPNLSFKGTSPLSLAAHRGFSTVVTLLMDNGATFNTEKLLAQGVSLDTITSMQSIFIQQVIHGPTPPSQREELIARVREDISIEILTKAICSPVSRLT